MRTEGEAGFDFAQPASTFAQPAFDFRSTSIRLSLNQHSTFAQPASTFAQPASTFAQPAFDFRSTSIEFRVRKLIENKKIKESAEIFTSIGEIL